MKRKRFSVEQIVAVLKQAEVGVPVAELIRQVGISEQTLYRWKKQYMGLETDQVRQFKQLQEENGAAEAVGGGADVGQGDVAGCAGKKTVTPSRRRPVVSYLHDAYRVSERRACRVARLAISTFRYRACRSRGRRCGCGFGRSLKLEFVMATGKSGCC